MKKIGERLKEIRLDRNYSQQRMGEELSVSQDTISLWEKGKSVPTAEFLIAIAVKFEVSVDYILCLKDF